MKSLRLTKNAKQLAEDLGLSEADTVVMELKSKLYSLASRSIQKSKLTHDEIANKIGTSRARITRISNLGENSLTIEHLVKIIVTLDRKIPLQVA